MTEEGIADPPKGSDDVANGEAGSPAVKPKATELIFELKVRPKPVGAGEVVMGEVRFRCKGGSLVLQNLYLLLYGEARTQNNQQDLSPDNREVFFREFVTLWDPLALGEMEMTTKEDWAFPFRYPLPSDLPPTYIGKVGTIRYFAQATAICKGQETEKKVR